MGQSLTSAPECGQRRCFQEHPVLPCPPHRLSPGLCLLVCLVLAHLFPVGLSPLPSRVSPAFPTIFFEIGRKGTGHSRRKDGVTAEDMIQPGQSQSGWAGGRPWTPSPSARSPKCTSWMAHPWVPWRFWGWPREVGMWAVSQVLEASAPSSN